ncbi:Na+/H+ antiporter NhaC [Aequitasia blattaphilus]|uniref:Uncharacterized protein n=1 Tax=Aequitasia blattaphilus TaxID=2949332 RepID=A0ABT1E823_9FIRM|nr:hypothetical protein [Aequitasia blattaphilus]MCP1101969.1 hypothetical protein [Aequitasia blattaphilus]MCR8614609.1 hypothetical protein [Aequitasia blattaphilus]
MNNKKRFKAIKKMIFTVSVILLVLLLCLVFAKKVIEENSYILYMIAVFISPIIGTLVGYLNFGRPNSLAETIITCPNCRKRIKVRQSIELAEEVDDEI